MDLCSKKSEVKINNKMETSENRCFLQENMVLGGREETGELLQWLSVTKDQQEFRQGVHLANLH